MYNLNIKQIFFFCIIYTLCIISCFAQLPTAPSGFASVNAMSQNGTYGGLGGDTVTVNNYDSLFYYATHINPYIISISGTISNGPIPNTTMIKVKSNKTIMGLNCNAVIDSFGLDIDSTYNIIVQNISFKNGGSDAISIRNGSHHIWIDHCEFSNYFDGLIDITYRAIYCDVSWNIFTNHNKTSLVGANDTHFFDIGRLKTTYHHNWFDGVNQRCPRVRFGEVHVVNNYYSNVTAYGVGSACNAKVLAESNYFKNSEDPLDTNVNSTPNPGEIKSINNIYDNCTGMVDTNGVAFNPSVYYTFVADSAGSIPSIVQSGAGVCGSVTSVQVVGTNTDEPAIVTPTISNGEFQIQAGNKELAVGKIEIYNTLGALVHSTIINNHSSIINLDVPSGIYFLKSISGSKACFQKIIVRH